MILTVIYYLRVAWTNPGFLIGSAADVAKKAGAYDPKDWIVNVSGVDHVSASGQNRDGSHERNFSSNDLNLDDIS